MMIKYIEIFRIECIDKKLSVNYNRNQYIKINKSVEEIAKIKIDYNNIEKIEDLELEGDENVLIYKNKEGNGDEFINIYCKTRIMITTEETINEDKYKKLPENVDYVIVDRAIYEVKEDFAMMRFKSSKRFEEYIEEIERHGKVNESNKDGYTALMIACYKGMERVAMELIPRMSEEAINKWDDEGRTALYYACRNKMERVAMELIPKMSEEAINKWHIYYEDTALIWACIKKMENVAMELIPKMSRKTIEKEYIFQGTALMIACNKKMERVAMKLIARMSKKAINSWNRFEETALTIACERNMEKVAMKLIPKMSEYAINKENNKGETALMIACKNRMERVKELIKTINNK